MRMKRKHGQRSGLPAKKEILDYLSAEEYRPRDAAGLARAMDVGKRGMDGFHRILRELENDGAVRTVKGRYEAVLRRGERKETGVIHVNKAGFGFVETGETADVYIPPEELNGAVSGDTVEISITAGERRAGRGPSGSVVRVTKRAGDVFTGVFYTAGKTGGYVLTEAPSLADGIDVAEESAKNARNGDWVQIRITKWPDRRRNASGEILKAHGEAGTWKAELSSTVSQFGLQMEFPEDCLREARACNRMDPGAAMPARADYRSLYTITIDPEDANDFDDAISLEKTRDGWKLYVHIADVAFYVKPGSAIDREARTRGTSVYLPGLAVPMLPPEVTGQICSIREKTDKPALTVAIEYTQDGERKSYRIAQSMINSDLRLNYNEVQEQVSKNGGREQTTRETGEKLAEMSDFAQVLRMRRIQDGAINLDIAKPHAVFDVDGRLRSIELISSNEAYQLVEEYMLAANQCVAEYLALWKLPGIYRIHDEPDIADMEAFGMFASQYGLTLAQPYTRKKLQKVIAKARQMACSGVIQMFLLRKMKRAVYSETVKEHYALAFNKYLHFTSPIRRYPDLFVHQVLRELIAANDNDLRPERKPVTPEEIRTFTNTDKARLALECSERERAAADAEDRLLRFRQIEHIRKNMHKVWNGVITGMASASLEVELEECWATGTVYMNKRRGKGYRYDRDRKVLSSKKQGRDFRLGDRIKVVVTRADIISQEIELKMTGKGLKSAAQKKK